MTPNTALANVETTLKCDQCLLYFRTIRNNIPVQNCLINAKGTNDEI